MSTLLLADITVFVLGLLVGFEVISKVPATLHTPLMSGANAIHGVVLIGVMLLAAVIIAVAAPIDTALLSDNKQVILIEQGQVGKANAQ